MAILNILRYPDKRLHIVAKPVLEVDEQIKALVSDMAETMYEAPGLGLAATQVDIHQRIIVIDTSETQDKLRVLINPEILNAKGESELEEGCLSVPGIFERVRRHEWIQVRAVGLDGRSYKFEAAGILSVCVQHEMDHLDGKVFVEYLSQLKRNRIAQKLRKFDRTPS
jgi:peptide deformylase